MAQDIPEIARKTICPHCRKPATQRLVCAAPYAAPFWAADGAEIEEPGRTFIATCDQCGQIILYDDLGEFLNEVNYQSGSVCYPTMDWRHSSVPSVVRQAYEVAMQFQAGEPAAFVSRAFNALQSVCDDQGVDGRTLRDRIRKLSDRGVIPDALAIVADRLMSSVEEPSLSAVKPMHAMHVWLFDQLVRAMIEHVYVAPAKLQDLAEEVALLTIKKA
jgi:hypothetical protein